MVWAPCVPTTILDVDFWMVFSLAFGRSGCTTTAYPSLKAHVTQEYNSDATQVSEVRENSVTIYCSPQPWPQLSQVLRRIVVQEEREFWVSSMRMFLIWLYCDSSPLFDVRKVASPSQWTNSDTAFVSVHPSAWKAQIVGSETSSLCLRPSVQIRMCRQVNHAGGSR